MSDHRGAPWRFHASCYALDPMIREPSPWSAAAFAPYARPRLLAAPADTLFDPRSGRALGRSDWDLDPELAADLAVMETPTPAAVLVPIVLRDEPSVLLTQRTSTLAKHAGQIAFPGGRRDPGDVDAVATALREADEEIGLRREHITPIGFLDGYRTGTGFHITPVVATVTPGFALTLQPVEVEAAFEVPLSFLMDPAHHQKHNREWRGRTRQFWAMPYGERYIWGATAGMLRNLFDRLTA
jgi:8-oxo-dGTP pyrophosphatase MutT (NUDIX family)